MALAAGLPLEAGLEAADALRQGDKGRLLEALHDVPLAGPLAALIREHLAALAVDNYAASCR